MNKNEELLPFYEALSKLIYWKNGKPYNKIRRHHNARKDALSGYIQSGGYRIVGIDLKGVCKQVLAHRLAWYMHYGVLPKGKLDHIKYKEKDNNRISNLREGTDSQHAQNKGGQKNTSSQYKGVDWLKANNKWRARIRIPVTSGTGMGKERHIGLFSCEHEAAEVYNKVAIEVFGEYAVLNITHKEEDSE